MKRRKFIQMSAGATALMSAPFFKGCSTQVEYDLLVKGGLVYDGTGGAGIEADVAVKGDRIAAIAPEINTKKAATVIDAGGMAVAPGFIDAHTHTDIQLIVNPKGESKIRQGVTTEIGGNCGGSRFPYNDDMFDRSKESLLKQYGLDLNWRDLAGYIGRLEQQGIGINHATLLGQGTLRSFVMGPYDRPPSDDELQQMKRVVREHMKAGVVGLSTGLEYLPGGFAKTEELIELCKEVSPFGGIHATHMRSEGDFLIESIEETMKICREAQVSTQISHFKTARPHNWYKIDDMLSAVENAVKDGLPVLCDRYPYHAWSTGLSFHFPVWAREGTSEDFVNKLKDKANWNRMKAHIASEGKAMGSWKNVVISSVINDKNRKFEGQSVLDAATGTGKTEFAFMRDLLIEEEGHVGMVGFGMSEDNLKRVLAHPLVVVGSDGNAVAPYGELGKGKPHPRFYGTFPRVLGKFSRDEGIMDLGTAVRKMTSMTADKFGLVDRGYLKTGGFADITVFDPGVVIDKATFVDPHNYAAGIPYVIVNGRVAVSEGEHTGVLAGQILRKSLT
ncbi:amidohydrolase family protein [Candidatus Latescibacterota bacterium]